MASSRAPLLAAAVAFAACASCGATLGPGRDAAPSNDGSSQLQPDVAPPDAVQPNPSAPDGTLAPGEGEASQQPNATEGQQEAGPVAWVPPDPAYVATLAAATEANLALQASLYAGDANVYFGEEDLALEAALVSLEICAGPDVGALGDASTVLKQAGDILAHVTEELYLRRGSSTSSLRSNLFLVSPYARAILALTQQDAARLQQVLTGLQGAAVTFADAARAVLLDHFGYLGYAPVGYGNREILPRVAWAVAFVLYADDANFAASRGAFVAYWRGLVDGIAQDPLENSGNYSALGLWAALQMSDVLGMTSPGRPEQMGVSRFGLAPLDLRYRGVVQRYAALVTPGGFLPAFGDDYLALIRLRSQPDSLLWPYLFERVGQWAPTDGAMLYQGRAMVARMQQFYRRALPAYTKAAAASAARQRLSATSRKTCRTVLESSPGPTLKPVLTQQGERLLLRPSAEPGAPSAMLDLYSLGDHAHVTSRGALSWYEVGQNPLFFNYGRYLQSYFYNNVLAFAADDAAYPFGAQTGSNMPQPFQDNDWHAVTLPSSLFLSRSFRQDDTAASTVFRATALPATGVGTCAVTNANWRLFDRSGNVSAMQLNTPYDAYTYPTIGYDSRVAGNPNSNCTSEQVRLAGSPGAAAGDANALVGAVNYHHVYDLWWPPTTTIIADIDEGNDPQGQAWTYAKNRGDDATAQVRFFRWGTHDSSGTRKVLLTREGVLFIVDTVLPGPRADQLFAGPLWQIYTLNPARGTDWFAESGELAYGDVRNPNQRQTMGFVVRFAASDPAARSAVASTRFGQSTGERALLPNLVRNNYQSNVAFVRSRLTRGVATSFVTAVLPGPAGSDWAALAEGLQLTVDAAGNLRATVAAGAGAGFLPQQLTVSLDGGTWQVVRGNG